MDMGRTFGWESVLKKPQINKPKEILDAVSWHLLPIRKEKVELHAKPLGGLLCLPFTLCR